MSSLHFLLFLFLVTSQAASYSRFGAATHNADSSAHVVKRHVVTGSEERQTGRFRSGGQDVLTRYLGFV